MGKNTLFLLDRTYDDALALLLEARDYAQSAQARHGQRANEDKLVASREAFRLTTRLTQVVSWLMVRKAVFNGELTAEQADEPARRLGAHEICCDDSAQGHPAIPGPMRDLLVRSHDLYMRVSRLDEHSRRTHGFPPQPGSPRPAFPSAPDAI